MCSSIAALAPHRKSFHRQHLMRYNSQSKGSMYTVTFAEMYSTGTTTLIDYVVLIFVLYRIFNIKKKSFSS